MGGPTRSRILAEGLAAAVSGVWLKSLSIADRLLGGGQRGPGPSLWQGLAGGDHLHFTMLVHGRAVNPVEWWDGHWMEDRVFRKIREAGGQAGAPAARTVRGGVEAPSAPTR